MLTGRLGVFIYTSRFIPKTLPVGVFIPFSVCSFELLLPLSEAPYKPFNVVLIPNLSIF